MPSKVVARLIVIRHFPSSYRERERGAIENYDLVSTPEQIEKNHRKAKQISRIFKNRDVVAFWTSPRQRARGTKEILKQHISVPVIKDKATALLEDIKVPPEQYETVLHELQSGEWHSKYREDPRIGKAGETLVESVEEIAERFKKIFRAFNRYIHMASPGDERKEVTNIIAVTHGEVPNDFLESVFGFGFSHHEDYERKEIGRGEFFIIEARVAQDGVLHYFAKMRGRTAEFMYDAKNKAFRLVENTRSSK